MTRVWRQGRSLQALPLDSVSASAVGETRPPRQDPWLPSVTKASSSTSGVQSVDVDIPSPVQLWEQQFVKSSSSPLVEFALEVRGHFVLKALGCREAEIQDLKLAAERCSL